MKLLRRYKAYLKYKKSHIYISDKIGFSNCFGKHNFSLWDFMTSENDKSMFEKRKLEQQKEYEFLLEILKKYD